MKSLAIRLPDGELVFRICKEFQNTKEHDAIPNGSEQSKMANEYKKEKQKKNSTSTRHDKSQL